MSQGKSEGGTGTTGDVKTTDSSVRYCVCARFILCESERGKLCLQASV